MPRKKAETPSKTTKTRKTEKKETKKVAEPKKETKKDTFTFGGSNGRMSKEERGAIIREAITPSKPKLSYTFEETQYVPKEWVVVVTPNGQIYQEPVPRYFPYNTFVAILAGIPSSPIVSNTIDFNAELHYTAFEVSGVDCNIVTCTFNGQRKENAYSCVFDIKNGTNKIGGNIVFAGNDKGFTDKQAQSVVKAIIKKFDKYEEKVEW